MSWREFEGLGRFLGQTSVFNFPSGLTGVHTLTGTWSGACEGLVESGLYGGPCEKPTDVVELPPLTITVTFV